MTMRGLTKSRTKRPLRARGANGLVFLACKLNLPLVPSQDYVLQDNKRCYDTILSDWNFLKTKSNNNNLCILRTKCSPSQTYDTGWRPPQCIYIAPKKMMVWQKELIVHALQGMKFVHVFSNSLSCLCSANSGPLDNNRRNCNQSWLKCSNQIHDQMVVLSVWCQLKIKGPLKLLFG